MLIVCLEWFEEMFGLRNFVGGCWGCLAVLTLWYWLRWWWVPVKIVHLGPFVLLIAFTATYRFITWRDIVAFFINQAHSFVHMICLPFSLLLLPRQIRLYLFPSNRRMISSFHHIRRRTFCRIVSILNDVKLFLNPVRNLLLLLRRHECVRDIIQGFLRFPSVLRIIITFYISLMRVITGFGFAIVGCFPFILSRLGAIRPNVSSRWLRSWLFVVEFTFGSLKYFCHLITR